MYDILIKKRKDMNITDEDALKYHEGGKLSTNITKSCEDQRDLSLAYTPGVAVPCLAIAKEKQLAYKYTTKANTVAVISNGTAVLGLGNLGAIASKPVMEGKVVLFKKFAKLDGVDIEIDETDPQKIVDICKAIAPTFGGINLEDIKSPECFFIEQELQKAVDIPVMHDDQHGTAIITAAGLLNACELANKSLDTIKVVISGSGAAAMSCAGMYQSLGVNHIIMTDSKGVLNSRRTDINEYKQKFAVDASCETLADAMVDADMFLGLSVAKIVTKDMVKSMAKNPIIFALSNPTPEILPQEIKEVRDDAIIATGRSDFPNQINNVLGFPFIFRGALDVQATKITENMKLEACRALAKLAKQPVPQYIKDIYGDQNLCYGKNYIIPAPFEKENLVHISGAVALAAFEDGVSGLSSFDVDKYKEDLRKLL